MIIQLYTMQTAEEALACVEAGADHVGLTPPQGLPGELPSLEAMRDIVMAVGDRARCVALTVDMDPARIITLVEVVKPAILHLCPLADAITPETVAALRARLPGIPVMQAVSVTGPESVRVACEYGEVADYLILDTQAPDIPGIGASGVTHDWSVSRAIVDCRADPGDPGRRALARERRGRDPRRGAVGRGLADPYEPAAARRGVPQGSRRGSRRSWRRPGVPDPYVVVLGDLNVDLTLALPDRSAPASERLVREPRQTGGGTAGNTAAALARLGVPVEFAGSVGDDGFGRWLVDDLRAAGVGTRGLVVTRDAPTCQVIAMVEPDGERYLVVWPLDGGALTRLAPGDVDRGLVAGAAWLHTTGMCLRASPVASSVLTAMRVARDAGVPVSIDLNLRRGALGPGRRGAGCRHRGGRRSPTSSWATARRSWCRWRGRPGSRSTGAEAAARALAGGTRTVVGRLGAQGALALLVGGRGHGGPGVRGRRPQPGRRR